MTSAERRSHTECRHWPRPAGGQVSFSWARGFRRAAWNWAQGSLEAAWSHRAGGVLGGRWPRVGRALAGAAAVPVGVPSLRRQDRLPALTGSCAPSTDLQFRGVTGRLLPGPVGPQSLRAAAEDQRPLLTGQLPAAWRTASGQCPGPTPRRGPQVHLRSRPGRVVEACQADGRGCLSAADPAGRSPGHCASLLTLPLFPDPWPSHPARPCPPAAPRWPRGACCRPPTPAPRPPGSKPAHVWVPPGSPSCASWAPQHLGHRGHSPTLSSVPSARCPLQPPREVTRQPWCPRRDPRHPPPPGHPAVPPHVSLHVPAVCVSPTAHTGAGPFSLRVLRGQP